MLSTKQRLCFVNWVWVYYIIIEAKVIWILLKAFTIVGL